MQLARATFILEAHDSDPPLGQYVIIIHKWKRFSSTMLIVNDKYNRNINTRMRAYMHDAICEKLI